jgi:hypothetical protein
LEFPAVFDSEGTAARFARLASQLRTVFGASSPSVGQDSSFHGEIEVPAAATSGGLMLRVVVSNFGDLAAVTSEEERYGDDAELAELLHPADAPRIYGALHDLGYVVVALDPLEEMYDGSSASLRVRGAHWWSRYFDYL